MSTPRAHSRVRASARLALPVALLLASGGSGSAAPPRTAVIAAGGIQPPGPPVRNPYRGDAKVARAGATLFTSMHCSDCHGDDAAGWVGPNLGDGRWRYGGGGAAVFRSIYYGRPRGMPAFGGMLGAQAVWVLVTYLKSLPPPTDMPTERFARR
ncbi:MAG TPA: c-type cytochrome [Steroidobacteraceae bacterium]|nr:c-type cytochrome [Steroidobacteraceae bacterium]